MKVYENDLKKNQVVYIVKLSLGAYHKIKITNVFNNGDLCTCQDWKPSGKVFYEDHVVMPSCTAIYTTEIEAVNFLVEHHKKQCRRLGVIKKAIERKNARGKG